MRWEGGRGRWERDPPPAGEGGRGDGRAFRNPANCGGAPSQYLSLAEGHRLVGVHSQPHLGQVLPHGFGVVPGMSDVGAAGKEGERGAVISPAVPARPAAS